MARKKPAIELRSEFIEIEVPAAGITVSVGAEGWTPVTVNRVTGDVVEVIALIVPGGAEIPSSSAINEWNAIKLDRMGNQFTSSKVLVHTAHLTPPADDYNNLLVVWPRLNGDAAFKDPATRSFNAKLASRTFTVRVDAKRSIWFTWAAATILLVPTTSPATTIEPTHSSFRTAAAESPYRSLGRKPGTIATTRLAPMVSGGLMHSRGRNGTRTLATIQTTSLPTTRFR